MNELQLEKALAYLPHGHFAAVQAVGRRYHGTLINSTFWKHSKRKDKDGSETYVDFEKKKIEILTWCESHHNGDIYDEERESVPWEAIEDLKPVVMTAMVAHMENQMKEERRREIRAAAERKVLELLE